MRLLVNVRGSRSSKMDYSPLDAYGARGRIGRDALVTLDTSCVPARQWHVARTSPAASRSSDAALSLRLEQVTKARRS